MAQSVPTLYVSRFFSGLSYGLAYSVTPMYLGEIASDSIRGAVSTLTTIMAKLGILYAFSIGPYVSVRTMAWLSLIPPILFLVTFIWLPETPYFYLGKNKPGEALKSLVTLRRSTQVTEELARMDEAVKKSQQNKGTFRDLFFKKGNQTGLIIILGLGTIQQICGSQAIIAYSQTIFEKLETGLGSSETTIISGVVQLVAAAMASTIVDVFGRRPLLISSIVGVALCNTIVGIFFNLERHDVDVSTIAWVPVMVLMIYMMFYVIGLATVTFVLLGEIFPKNLKAIAASVFMVNSSCWAFIVTKLFQVVSDGLGSDYTFFGFAFFSYLAIPFMWYFVPETKGKPLDQILIEMNAPHNGVIKDKHDLSNKI